MIEWKKEVKNLFSDNEFTFSYYRGEKRCDNIFCFDVESTSYYIHPDNTIHAFDKALPMSFYEECLKGGIVYIWMFSIDDKVYYGRFLEDFKIFVNSLTEYLRANILVFVHNLSFECQWLRNVFDEDVSIFARKKRKPLKINDGAVEYRCTYMLTRLSLENWAKGKRLPVQKMVGDLDYNVLRTPYTFMDEKTELVYCENDVLIMYHGIKQFVRQYGCVWDIPLTQTGIVRREYNNMLKDNEQLHRIIAKITPDYELYCLLLAAFWGGIAHASFKWVNELLYNVVSYDKKSSYPWELISRKYPMTPFVKCKFRDEYMHNDHYSYLITVELKDFKTKMSHTYISSHKCKHLTNVVMDNGRVVSADYAVITCTNIDYEIILDSYDIKEKNILDFRVSINQYLPDEVRLFVIDWFEKKTILDGVDGEEEMYKRAKEFINAIFGMFCTKEFMDEITYIIDEWGIDKLTEEKFHVKLAKKLSKKKKLNNAFQWGVWCTAYARQSLWDSVAAEIDGEKIIDPVSVYLDTDSNKLFACEKVTEWFKRYNEMIWKKQNRIADDLGIPVEKIRPRRPDGKICAMGVYEYEGIYSEFKTLGAKKYCYKQKDKDGIARIHITVSGVRKAAADQIRHVDDFKSSLVFDIDHAKKNIMHYNDDQEWVVINRGKYDEFACMYKYGCCLQPTTYSLTMEPDFAALAFDFLTLYSECLDDSDIIERMIENAEKRKALQS